MPVITKPHKRCGSELKLLEEKKWTLLKTIHKVGRHLSSSPVLIASHMKGPMGHT